VFVLSFLVAAGGAPDAAAQFDRIKKALPKAAGAGKPEACIPDRPPTYVETVNLTAAQMAAINAGFDAEIETAPVVFEEADRQQKAAEKAAKEYEKARADYDKRNEKYQACADKVLAADAAKSDELSQRSEAAGEAVGSQVNEADLEKLAARAAAAAERVSQGKGTAEDRQTMAEFQRVMAGIQTSSTQAASAQQEATEHNQQQDARLEKACGPRPVEPVPPSGPDLPGQKIREAGAKAARMSDRDYAVGREEMLALAMGHAVVKPSGKVSKDDADAMNQGIKEAGNKICALRKAGAPL
jgi:hypothetical protein